MNTKSVICRGQARTIEDAIEAWKVDHDDAMEVRDIEDVISVCHMLSVLLQEWQKEVWESLFSNRLSNVASTGDLLRTAYRHTLQAFEGVADCLHRVKQLGYEVDKAASFQQTFETIRRLSAGFSRRWPILEPASVELARAQIACGEFLSVEDIQRELHG